MSMALVLCGVMVLLITPSAVVFLVCIGVGGCGCPIAMSSWQAGMDSLQLMQRVPSYTSAADDMTNLMICAMARKAPLLGGSVEFLERKKWPAAQLQALVSDR